MAWKDWIVKKEVHESEQINSMNSRIQRRAYHKYFEGYTEVRRIRPNGKGYTIERIYTGTYYQSARSESARALLKILFVVLVAGACALFVWGATRRTAVNSVWYIALVEAVACAMCFWTVVSAVNYLISPCKMTVYEYRSSSKALIRSTFAASIALVAILIPVFVYCGYYRAFGSSETFMIGSDAAAAACMLAVNWIERKTRYEKIVSEHSGKVPGTEIS